MNWKNPKIEQPREREKLFLIFNFDSLVAGEFSEGKWYAHDCLGIIDRTIEAYRIDFWQYADIPKRQSAQV